MTSEIILKKTATMTHCTAPLHFLLTSISIPISSYRFSSSSSSFHVLYISLPTIMRCRAVPCVASKKNSLLVVKNRLHYFDSPFFGKKKGLFLPGFCFLFSYLFICIDFLCVYICIYSGEQHPFTVSLSHCLTHSLLTTWSLTHSFTC